MPFHTSRFRLLPLVIALQAATIGAVQAADFSVAAGSTDSTAKTLTTGNTGSVASGGSLSTSAGTSVDITGTSGTVTLNNSGTIANTGSGRAIDNNTNGVSIVINNDGTISSVSSDGLRLNKANSSLVLNNNGTIKVTGSGTSGGQAIDLRGADGTGSKVINNGSATNKNAVISSSNDDALRPGSNTTINNYGSIISTGVVNTKCPDYISACSSAASAMDAIDSKLAVTVNNWGTISGPRHGVTSDAGVTVTNYKDGQIIGRNGSGVGSDGVGTVVNYGLISGRYAGAGNVYEHLGGSTGYSTANNGDGDGVDIDGIASITNYGRIEGLGAGGVDSGGMPNGADGIAAGGGTIINYAGGEIFGQSKGILIDDGANGTSIAAKRGTATAVGGVASITNAGSIIGADSTAIGLVGNFADSLTNLAGGVIRGGAQSVRVDELLSSTAAAAVQMGDGNDTVSNAGSIVGLNGLALDMGTGDDNLTVFTTGTFGGLVDGGTGTDTLTLSGTGNGTFGNSQNFETLAVTGGNWTVSSTDFSAGGSVAGGASLINQGSIGGLLTIANGASYGGTGRLNSLQLNSGSTFNYSLDAGGTAVQVSGTATLNNATLNLTANGTGYAQHTQLLTATGGVSGQFGSVTNNFAFLTPTLTYTGNAVELDLKRNDTAFAELASNDSARNLANTLAAQSNNSLYNALLTTDKATAAQALEQLSGASNASMAAATLAGSSQVSSVMQGAMAQLGSLGGSLQASILRDDGPQLVSVGVPNEARGLHDPKAAGRLWVQALGSHGSVDGEHGNHDVDQNTGGTLFGADWAMNADWRLGVVGGYSRTDIDAGSGASGDVDSYHVGVYALTQIDQLTLRMGAAYSRHDGENKRRVSFAGVDDKLHGDYDADSQQAFAELAYPITNGRLLAEPFAALGYQRYARDAYSEKGGDSALRVDDQDQDNVSSTLGLRIAHLGQFDNGMSFTPRMSLGWRHTYGDVDSETRQAFISGGSSFSAQGTALDRNTLLLEAGFDVGITATQSLGLGYAGEMGSNAQNHGVIAQWQLAF
ncbi:MAG: autotransporter domain-containing protein [Pseudomonas sp.]